MLGPPGREAGCNRHQRDFPENGVCVRTVSIVSMVSGPPEDWLSVAVAVALTVPTVFSTKHSSHPWRGVLAGGPAD